MFSIAVVSLIESGANLFTVINNGLTFLGSGLAVSVDEWFRFDVFLFFCNMNLSSFSSVELEELKTSFEPLCIRVPCELFAVPVDPILCYCLEIA